MELETLKKHLRVSHSMEDDLIETYHIWAEAEVMDSVTTSPERDESFFKDNKIFERAVFLLTAHYFEQRIAYSDIQLTEVPSGVTSAVQKLRGAYNYES